MTCNVIIVTNRGLGLESLPSILADSPMYSLSHSILAYFYSIHSILLCDGTSTSGSHQEVLDGSASSKKHMYQMLVTDDLDTFIEPLYV